MRSREGLPRPCNWCQSATRFEIAIVGSRGGVHTYPCCVECGEQPARREKQKPSGQVTTTKP